jgi:hypothetical protein
MQRPSFSIRCLVGSVKPIHCKRIFKNYSCIARKNDAYRNILNTFTNKSGAWNEKSNRSEFCKGRTISNASHSFRTFLTKASAIQNKKPSRKLLSTLFIIMLSFLIFRPLINTHMDRQYMILNLPSSSAIDR